MTDYNDYPVKEVLANIEEKAKEGWECFIKFTCSKCKSRQTASDNTWHPAGYTCEECGHLTVPTGINFLAVKKLKGGDTCLVSRLSLERIIHD